ncbi:AAA family ATPase [Okeania sp. SIO1I7]|uniref:AAA family ATPase n=1 Tax=Okeania sp. SIO1I7 TaxID=2607772 RepID=UPI0013F953E0|nr:AAA family ATPase [Okeania sp. SIO1I7]NET28178.1 AAA family ATPase [Okeania sp. SIO1I7]
MISSTNRKNPYIIGRPIYEKELFFGRDNLFNFIDANLNNNEDVILLHGQRRIGKSSVLYQIPNFVGGDKFVFVYFDLQDKARLTLAEVLENLATEIIRKVELKQDNIKPPLKTDLEANSEIFSEKFLPQVFENLGDRNLVLLLDEFDVLSNDNPTSAIEDFFPYLGSIISNHQQLFIIPVVGRRLDDMKNLLNLFRRAPNQEIGLLDDKSAAQLIAKPAEGVLEYGEDAIAAILELSAGHPYFTQVICFQVFQQVEAENNWQVRSANVNNIVVDRAIKSAEGGLTWFRDRLPVPERVIFSAVAEAQRIAAMKPTQVVKEPLTLLKEYGVVPTESLFQAADRLVEWGVLDTLESSELPLEKVPRYRLKIELVRRWLLKRYSLRGEVQELENLSSEASHIYKLATELRQTLVTLTSVIAIYEQVLEINPNHFKVLFDLAEAYLVLEDFGKAIEFYQRGYQVNPILAEDGLVESLLGYGQKLMEQRKWEIAKEQFEKVLNLDPDNTLAQERLIEIKQPPKRKIERNPFTIGQPVAPERFVGRENLIATAFDQIYNRSNLAIWGAPGMGKTSFLNLLTSEQVWHSQDIDPSTAVIVYLNCLEITPFMAASFWRRIIYLIREKTEDDSVLQNIILELLKKPKSTKDHLRYILKKLGQQNKFLVLLLDDYDATLNSHSQYTETDIEVFLTECRNLAHHSEERKYLSMIVTSLRRLNEKGFSLTTDGSPWYNHFGFQRLTPLNDKEIGMLLSGMSMTGEIREGIEEIAGGNPALLQNAGFILYNTIRSGETISAEVFARDFFAATKHFFQDTWQLANPLEQELLMLIALYNLKDRVQKIRYDLSDISVVFNHKERELMDLEERCVIKRTVENTNYSFTSAIMEWWVIREIENYNAETFKHREKLFLYFMSRQQAEQVINVINYLSKNKEATKSIVKWVGKLAAYLV